MGIDTATRDTVLTKMTKAAFKRAATGHGLALVQAVWGKSLQEVCDRLGDRDDEHGTVADRILRNAGKRGSVRERSFGLQRFHESKQAWSRLDLGPGVAVYRHASGIILVHSPNDDGVHDPYPGTVIYACEPHDSHESKPERGG